MMKRPVAAGLLGLCLSMTAASADVLASFRASGGCYARVYDAAHLASHPEQRVAAISLRQSDLLDPEGRLVLTLGFTLRNGEAYGAEAYCSAGRAGASCGIEGDGGSFDLSLSGEDLRLEVGEFLMVEGASDFSPDLADGGDDRVFLLRPSAFAACG
jgi:hypothetical protein